MIENYELELARLAMDLAAKEGAQKSRVCLSKSVSDIISTLDGQIDKVSHCLDRGLSLTLFVDGRFGTFSTNQLDEASLRDFVSKAVAMTRILAVDEMRDLPDPARCCKTAGSGDELGLYDPEYSKVTAEERRNLALKAAVTGKIPETPEYRLISEEGEYSDSEFDAVTLDSNGLFCRHKETSFEYGVEVTVEDNKITDPDGSELGFISALDINLETEEYISEMRNVTLYFGAGGNRLMREDRTVKIRNSFFLSMSSLRSNTNFMLMK